MHKKVITPGSELEKMDLLLELVRVEVKSQSPHSTDFNFFLASNELLCSTWQIILCHFVICISMLFCPILANTLLLQ